ncbi:MAG: hypothetical protein HOW73_20540 [Polyangiaceae bacterium]|nr:hypothetical protein [Polyangiaceae bacterium]
MGIAIFRLHRARLAGAAAPVVEVAPQVAQLEADEPQTKLVESPRDQRPQQHGNQRHQHHRR